MKKLLMLLLISAPAFGMIIVQENKGDDGAATAGDNTINITVEVQQDSHAQGEDKQSCCGCGSCIPFLAKTIKTIVSSLK